MARAFRAPFSAMALDVYGPHMLSHLFPALATTLAMSLEGVGDGGTALRFRRHRRRHRHGAGALDTAETMAWIVVVVCVLIVVDHLALQPLQRRMELWRDDDRARRS